tara:strand:+ start:355 stop:624 length:270 start_codon:yes stop_codon:yes gene_type:complete
MKYKIETRHVWLNDTSNLVLMYFINGVPFTFDDAEEQSYYDYDIIDRANNDMTYTLEYLYKTSSYLISEECHPMLYELELDNPELLPIE